MGSESKQKSLTRFRRLSVRLLIFFLITLSTILLIFSRISTVFLNHEETKLINDLNVFSLVDHQGEVLKKATSSTSWDKIVEKLDSCTISNNFSSISSFKNIDGSSSGEKKPIWLPYMPTSLSDQSHRTLISLLTGLDTGGRSFYSSIKGKLRQCLGDTTTVTCSNIHPWVEMNGGPDAKLDSFQNTYIMVLRNPITYFPAFQNEKAIKYHGLPKGDQVIQEDWVDFRNNYINDVVDQVKLFLTSWMESKFKVGIILTHEDLMDAEIGPSAIRSLGYFLSEAGFPVNNFTDEDFSCIWYKSFGKENLQRYHQYQYAEYKDYNPMYRQKDINLLAQELAKLQSNMQTLLKDGRYDQQLVKILGKYLDFILDYKYIETEF